MNQSPDTAAHWLCVYCGSRSGRIDAYCEAAAAFGDALGRAGLGLVYGGARVGLMGAVADAALAAGAPVIGVIPRALVHREMTHEGLTDLRVVDTMHQRKMMMSEAADGFVALPGGLGTLEELFEMLTWYQIGWHHKPIGLLDADGFYQPLIACIQHMRDEGFVSAAHVAQMLVNTSPAALVAGMVERIDNAKHEVTANG